MITSTSAETNTPLGRTFQPGSHSSPIEETFGLQFAPRGPAPNSRSGLDLEVFGTVPGGASAMSSGGAPSRSTVTVTMRARSSVSAARTGSVCLGQNHQAFGAAGLLGSREHCHAAGAEAWEVAYRTGDGAAFVMAAQLGGCQDVARQRRGVGGSVASSVFASGRSWSPRWMR